MTSPLCLSPGGNGRNRSIPAGFRLLPSAEFGTNRKTRRKLSAEGKIRVVTDGLRGTQQRRRDPPDLTQPKRGMHRRHDFARSKNRSHRGLARRQARASDPCGREHDAAPSLPPKGAPTATGHHIGLGHHSQKPLKLRIRLQRILLTRLVVLGGELTLHLEGSTVRRWSECDFVDSSCREEPLQRTAP